MEEVVIQFGLGDGPIVVAVDILVDRDTHLVCVWFEDMRKVGSFGLGWDTFSGWTVAGQAGDGVEGRFDHPVPVVLFDRGFDGTFQPCLVLIDLATVELVENLQSEIGEEGRLGSSEILDLAVSRGDSRMNDCH
jgi:hypothetical protein